MLKKPFFKISILTTTKAMIRQQR